MLDESWLDSLTCQLIVASTATDGNNTFQNIHGLIRIESINPTCLRKSANSQDGCCLMVPVVVHLVRAYMGGFVDSSLCSSCRHTAL